MGSFSPVKGSEVTGFPRASHIKVIEEIVEPFGDHTRFLLSRGQLLVLPDQERAQHENQDHEFLMRSFIALGPLLMDDYNRTFLNRGGIGRVDLGAWRVLLQFTTVGRFLMSDCD